jgi:hypothetical protein
MRAAAKNNWLERSSRRPFGRETQEQTLDPSWIISHLKLMNLNVLDKLKNQLMSTFTARAKKKK